MMIFELLGILSSFVFIAGDIPYFINTLKGSTRPHRVSWGISLLLGIIGFANQHAAGARNSLWILGAGIIAVGAIFSLSIVRGVGGTSKLDVISLVISLLGVALWLIIKNPALSIIANIFASLVGLYPTIVKSKLQPESETVSAYLFGSISSLMATVSVGKIDALLLAPPIYGALIQAYLVYLIAIKPKDTRV